MFTLEESTHNHPHLVGVFPTLLEAREHARERSKQYGRLVFRVNVWPSPGISYSVCVCVYDRGAFIEEWTDDSSETVRGNTLRWENLWYIFGPSGQRYSYWTQEEAEHGAAVRPGFVVMLEPVLAPRHACCEGLEAAEVGLRRIIHAEQQKVRESLTPTE